jgi:hypothetical protein
MIFNLWNYEIFFKKSESGQFCGCFWLLKRKLAHLQFHSVKLWNSTYTEYPMFLRCCVNMMSIHSDGEKLWTKRKKGLFQWKHSVIHEKTGVFELDGRQFQICFWSLLKVWPLMRIFQLSSVWHRSFHLCLSKSLVSLLCLFPSSSSLWFGRPQLIWVFWAFVRSFFGSCLSRTRIWCCSFDFGWLSPCFVMVILSFFQKTCVTCFECTWTCWEFQKETKIFLWTEFSLQVFSSGMSEKQCSMNL